MINPVVLFLLFLKASALSFGGLGGLPILHQDLALRMPPTDVDRLLGQALAVGRLSPGPNGLYVVSVGYLMQGIVGGIAGGVALALPPFFVLAIALWYAKVAHLKRTANALMVLSFALTGLLGFTSWQIIAGSSTNAFEWAAGIIGFVVSARTQLHPLVLIGITGLIGIALYH